MVGAWPGTSTLHMPQMAAGIGITSPGLTNQPKVCKVPVGGRGTLCPCSRLGPHPQKWPGVGHTSGGDRQVWELISYTTV